MAVIAGKDKAFLNCFWDLACDDIELRIKAGELLLSHVQVANEVASSGSLDINSAMSKGDGAYALERLVKGLASSRDFARQGFATALSTLLQHLGPKYDAFTVLSVLDSTCKVLFRSISLFYLNKSLSIEMIISLCS